MNQPSCTAVLYNSIAALSLVRMSDKGTITLHFGWIVLGTVGCHWIEWFVRVPRRTTILKDQYVSKDFKRYVFYFLFFVDRCDCYLSVVYTYTLVLVHTYSWLGESRLSKSKRGRRDGNHHLRTGGSLIHRVQLGCSHASAAFFTRRDRPAEVRALAMDNGLESFINFHWFLVNSALCKLTAQFLSIEQEDWRIRSKNYLQTFRVFLNYLVILRGKNHSSLISDYVVSWKRTREKVRGEKWWRKVNNVSRISSTRLLPYFVVVNENARISSSYSVIGYSVPFKNVKVLVNKRELSRFLSRFRKSIIKVFCCQFGRKNLIFLGTIARPEFSNHSLAARV